MRTIIFITILLATSARAAEPWLLSFPRISYDDKRVYFCGEQWCGYFSLGLGTILTVPRDSVNPPMPPVPSRTVGLEGALYTCVGNRIEVSRAGYPDTAYTMPLPGLDAMRYLASLTGSERLRGISPYEYVGPMTSSGKQLFFGLQLVDSGGVAVTGGIGWLTPETHEIARIYSPELVDLQPVWISAVADTVNALFVKTRAGKRVRSAWIRFIAGQNDLYQVDLQKLGIPGETIIEMESWNNAVLLCTEQAIAINWPDGVVDAWTTKTYASPEGGWLHMREFDTGDTVRFITLPPGRPTMVKAWVDGWMELASPEGVEAYVDTKAWKQDSARWTSADWNCESTCFARLRVPSKGSFMTGDVTNTMLSFLGRDRNGVKVGFRVGWIREGQVVPVLVPEN